MLIRRVFILLFPLFVPLPIAAEVDENWSAFLKSYYEFAYPFSKQMVQILNNISIQNDITINSLCRSHLQLWADELVEGKANAVAMFDSFSKLKPGQSDKMVYDFGYYETCLNAKIDGYPGSFHLLRVDHPLPSIQESIEMYTQSSTNYTWYLQQSGKASMLRVAPMLYGICVPSSCDRKDISSVVSSSYIKDKFYPINLLLEEPYSNDTSYYALAKSVCKIFIWAILFVNLLSTIFNFEGNSVLGFFNMKNNMHLLTREPLNASTQFINNWKVIYMITSTLSHLVIPITHHALYLIGLPAERMLRNDRFRRNLLLFPSLVSLNFIMTGTLSIFIWNMTLKTRKVSFMQFIMVRALRTLPVALFMACFLIILPDFGFTGPMMEIFTGNMSGNCYQNALSEFLYYSNYVSIHTMCFRTGWFVSADMHLYICSFFLVTYLCKNRPYESCIRVLRLAVIGAMIVNFIYMLSVADVIATILSPHAEWIISDIWPAINFYMSTSQYALPYMMGLWLGFEMANGNQWSKEKASLYYYSPLCLIPFVILLQFVDLPNQPLWIASLALTCTSSLFALTNSSCLYASWSLKSDEVTTLGHICTVISRIQYPYFLIHPLIVSFLVIWLDHLFNSYWHMFVILLPVEIIMSIVLSCVIHVMVEVPFANLLNTALKKKRVKGEIANGKSDINANKTE